MKRIKLSIIIISMFALFAACAKDNYSAPSSEFNGRIVFQGEPINVEQGQVGFELWQPGFGRSGAIGVSIAQDGTYASLLFNGSYKLVFPANQGPFLWKRNTQGVVDTMAITINGSQTLDIEVMPYYMIRNAKLNVSAKTVTATCRIEKIITDAEAKNIERVSLYINKTRFVSGHSTQNIIKTDIAIAEISDLNNVSITASIPEIIPTQNYVFARIGVKIMGVEDMIFSELEKLDF